MSKLEIEDPCHEWLIESDGCGVNLMVRAGWLAHNAYACVISGMDANAITRLKQALDQAQSLLTYQMCHGRA